MAKRTAKKNETSKNVTHNLSTGQKIKQNLDKTKALRRKKSKSKWIILGSILFVLCFVVYQKLRNDDDLKDFVPFGPSHEAGDIFENILQMIDNGQSIDLYFAAEQLCRIERNNSRSLYSSFQSHYSVEDFDNALVYLQLMKEGFDQKFIKEVDIDQMITDVLHKREEEDAVLRLTQNITDSFKDNCILAAFKNVSHFDASSSLPSSQNQSLSSVPYDPLLYPMSGNNTFFSRYVEFENSEAIRLRSWLSEVTVATPRLGSVYDAGLWPFPQSASGAAPPSDADAQYAAALRAHETEVERELRRMAPFVLEPLTVIPTPENAGWSSWAAWRDKRRGQPIPVADEIHLSGVVFDTVVDNATAAEWGYSTPALSPSSFFSSPSFNTSSSSSSPGALPGLTREEAVNPLRQFFTVPDYSVIDGFQFLKEYGAVAGLPENGLSNASMYQRYLAAHAAVALCVSHGLVVPLGAKDERLLARAVLVLAGAKSTAQRRPAAQRAERILAAASARERKRFERMFETRTDGEWQRRLVWEARVRELEKKKKAEEKKAGKEMKEDLKMKDETDEEVAFALEKEYDSLSSSSSPPPTASAEPGLENTLTFDAPSAAEEAPSVVLSTADNATSANATAPADLPPGTAPAIERPAPFGAGVSDEDEADDAPVTDPALTLSRAETEARLRPVLTPEERVQFDALSQLKSDQMAAERGQVMMYSLDAARALDVIIDVYNAFVAVANEAGVTAAALRREKEGAKRERGKNGTGAEMEAKVDAVLPAEIDENWLAFKMAELRRDNAERAFHEVFKKPTNASDNATSSAPAPEPLNFTTDGSDDPHSSSSVPPPSLSGFDLTAGELPYYAHFDGAEPRGLGRVLSESFLIDLHKSLTRTSLIVQDYDANATAAWRKKVDRNAFKARENDEFVGTNHTLIRHARAADVPQQVRRLLLNTRQALRDRFACELRAAGQEREGESSGCTPMSEIAAWFLKEFLLLSPFHTHNALVGQLVGSAMLLADGLLPIDVDDGWAPATNNMTHHVSVPPLRAALVSDLATGSTAALTRLLLAAQERSLLGLASNAAGFARAEHARAGAKTAPALAFFDKRQTAREKKRKELWRVLRRAYYRMLLRLPFTKKELAELELMNDPDDDDRALRTEEVTLSLRPKSILPAPRPPVPVPPPPALSANTTASEAQPEPSASSSADELDAMWRKVLWRDVFHAANRLASSLAHYADTSCPVLPGAEDVLTGPACTLNSTTRRSAAGFSLFNVQRAALHCPTAFFVVERATQADKAELAALKEAALPVVEYDPVLGTPLVVLNYHYPSHYPSRREEFSNSSGQAEAKMKDENETVTDSEGKTKNPPPPFTHEQALTLVFRVETAFPVSVLQRVVVRVFGQVSPEGNQYAEVTTPFVFHHPEQGQGSSEEKEDAVFGQLDSQLDSWLDSTLAILLRP